MHRCLENTKTYRKTTKGYTFTLRYPQFIAVPINQIHFVNCVQELETKLEAELQLKVPEQDPNFEVMN